MAVAAQRKSFKSRTTITESVALEAAGDRIDEAAHVVRGVKVIGRKSAHGYEYSAKAVSEAAALYEGARVYVGHRRAASDSRTGSYGERLGLLKNFTVKEGEGYADLHYNPHHPQAAQFLYDVRNNPNMLGFSHHADIRTSSRSGKTIVESIDKLHSVDLVNVPATTKGVFESQGDTMLTLKQLIEAAEPKSLTVLEDMMAGGAMAADMPVEAADGSDSDAQIKAAFESAIVAKFRDDSLDYKGTLAAVKNILQAYDKLSGGGAPKPEAKPEPKGGATESVDDLRAELTELKRRDEVRTLAAKEGVQLSDIALKAAVAMESADDRAAFVKELPKLGAQKQPAPTKPTTTTTTQESAPDAAPPAFKTQEERLAFLRGNS
jgi:hypothetical protein